MNENKYGYIEERPKDGDYIHGDGLLGDVAINSTGQWELYLPDDTREIQNSNGFETFACVTEATLHTAETLQTYEYGSSLVYSVRCLATLSGTGPNKGNGPNTVAETLKTYGVCQADDYTFKAPDYETFYQDLPANIKRLAKIQFANNKFGHSWLANTKPETIMGALTFSPVGASIYWKPTIGSDGLYHRPADVPDTHFITIYGYEKGVAWHAFDSYEQTHVKLAWDYRFGVAKRYTLNRVIPTTPSPSGWINWVTFIAYWRKKLGL